jgi:hypothetical protein
VNQRPDQSRIKLAFQLDALLEMTLGLVLLGNPLFGPDLGISSYVVMLVGVGLLVVAILLGGAGLGKGPLAQRLPLVAALNVASGVLFVGWAFVSSRSTGSKVFLVLIAAALFVLAAYQRMAIKRPETVNRRRPSTQAERQAALRGEKPRVD